MSFRTLKYSGALLLIISSMFFCSNSPMNELKKTDAIKNLMMRNISQGHYSTLNLNDSLSSKIFDEYIRRLDYGKRFLLQSDVDQLEKYRFKIDDQLKKDPVTIYQEASEIINKRIKEAEKYYLDIIDKPFDFTKEEVIQLDPEELTFAKTTDELKDYWRKSLKYDIMNRIVDKLKMQEDAKEKNDTTVKQLPYDSVYAQSVEKIRKRYHDWFHRMYKIEENDRRNNFFNTVANVIDPHTGYFPPKDKEDFDIKMSGKLEGIGALLSQSDEYIKVERIVPGSPSYKQGELEAGDIIMAVAQAEEEPVDVVDMRLDKAVRLIRGPKGSEVRLTVKKIDGAIKIIPIIRDVVYQEETFAKSAIIEEDNGAKVGVIKLPSFYIDMKDPRGKNCSKDMKEEIRKLKEENVDGIIVDLRNNGGGSLQYAVEIAGLFFDKGPVVQVHSRYGQPYIFQDRDPSVQYGGPLIVLVNNFSASASEIFAAAMQDYGRAMIMGTKSSYGKGTVQRFFDLDERLPKMLDDVKPLGSIKMTIQKFYRINGDATQLKGVIPDIIMPDYYKYIDIGEAEYDFAMPWDEIQPSQYKPLNSIADKDEIIKNAYARIEKDTLFRLIDENAKRLKELREDRDYTLNMENFRKFKEEREESGKKFKRIGKDSLGLICNALEADIPELEADSTKLASAQEWRKSLVKDIYLFEAYKVMQDMIKNP